MDPEEFAERAYETWCAEQYAAAFAVTEPGFYLHAGKVFRVQPSQSSGYLYALVLEVDEAEKKGRFEYAPGMVRQLVTPEKLTTEQAALLGHHYGVCVICGATLTDPKSVDQGIGPVCIKKLAA